ncbi:SWIM zinc finger family protein [Nonomuraea sp. NPDC050536]|uniref:SWIM zinc finger family protein n=1 Tax=Nonomuraea sp. NPDC050536 TaxID=3364366 RepID=UPI0037CA3579
MTDAKGFAAFPAQQAGARFATTWWGRSWLKALEDTSLDQGLLRKGRAYAKTGQVGPITVSPGRLAAVTENEYDTVVTVEQLTDAEWDRFLDQIASQAGHLAALLEGEVPQALADAGVPLLPAVGDLEPDCSCPDWGHPCKHAAALCYQASWLLDADPFVLLLLRGRGRRDLIEALQTRDAPVEGVPVEEARALGVPPLPEPPPLEFAFQPLDLEPADGVQVGALAVLAADAADQARELLVHGRLAVLTEYQDRVRLAAAHGLEVGLGAAVQAWRHGGAGGLEALESAWTPPRQELARARAGLVAAWEGEAPQVQEWRNRWTIGALQLRFGRDGRWYPFTEREGEWWPSGPPERDPWAFRPGVP